MPHMPHATKHHSEQKICTVMFCMAYCRLWNMCIVGIVKFIYQNWFFVSLCLTVEMFSEFWTVDSRPHPPTPPPALPPPSPPHHHHHPHHHTHTNHTHTHHHHHHYHWKGGGLVTRKVFANHDGLKKKLYHGFHCGVWGLGSTTCPLYVHFLQIYPDIWDKISVLCKRDQL